MQVCKTTKFMKNLFKLALSLTLLSACYDDNKEELYQNLNVQTTECDTASGVSYSECISPILEANCALSGCHVGTSPQSGIDLSNFNDVERVALDGRLLGTITGSPGPQMPPSGAPLSATEIDLIRTWVENGAQNN